MLQKKNIFFKESSFNVAGLIFTYPNKSFHIRMLEKETGFSTTAITRVIDEFRVHQIITIEKTPLTTNIQANVESPTYYSYKRIFNLYQLEREGIVATLIDLFKPKVIVLFGSYARGEDGEKSDVDLLIITPYPKRSGDTGRFLERGEKTLKRKINLHILTSLNNSSTEFKNALANGIVLQGYLKVVE
ncbi:nucleotidyltransferase domain-containing protein [Candidatus Woesearchaeota archaeon]|nr:nucleotidyltransferase domain-containing protein [Candidatus Woesearchaeota archaeon]